MYVRIQNDDVKMNWVVMCDLNDRRSDTLFSVANSCNKAISLSLLISGNNMLPIHNQSWFYIYRARQKKIIP